MVLRASNKLRVADKLELGQLQPKLPPIVSHNWRRITFIVTSGDRFEAAEEINDLFEDKSPAGPGQCPLLCLKQ